MKVATMATKLDTIRIKNVLDAINVLERAAERLEKSKDPYLKSLAKKILSLSEDDVVMELSIELGWRRPKTVIPSCES